MSSSRAAEERKGAGGGATKKSVAQFGSGLRRTLSEWSCCCVKEVPARRPPLIRLLL